MIGCLIFLKYLLLLLMQVMNGNYSVPFAVFMVLYTVPALYEKYEDKVDAFGEKAMIELKKYYAIFDEKCLSKIPKGPLKDKKH
jgi:hypothetical protein